MRNHFARVRLLCGLVVLLTLGGAGCDSDSQVATDDAGLDQGGVDQLAADGGDADVGADVGADGALAVVDSGGATDAPGGDAFLPSGCGAESAPPLYEDPPEPNVSPRRVNTPAGGTRGANDGQGTAAQFDRPRGLARGRDGMIYLTDCNNHTIRRVDPTSWQVTTLAGSPGEAGDEDGVGAQARFNCPWALVELSGLLYVADTYNSTIRRVDPESGAVTTVAGQAGEHAFADGVGRDARFLRPAGITTDGRALFVADTGNHVIRRLDPATGTVGLFAGAVGLGGHEDGTCRAARFTHPTGVTSDGPRLFVSDSGSSTIRRVDVASGEVSTVAGLAFSFQEHADGAGEQARFYFPAGLATDGTSLFVADSNNRVIRQITIATREVSTIAGAPAMVPTAEVLDGVGTDARFSGPSSVVATQHDTLVVVDWVDNRLRQLSVVVP